MKIRLENKTDYAAVHDVNLAAFGSEDEANLVTRLRQQAQSYVSLVAEEKGVVIGHIMFSGAHLSADPKRCVMALAPMAVLPEFQQRGIGSSLVKSGLEHCENQGYGAIFVLGHAQYYPRFGFKPADSFSIDSVYEVPAGVFMALELTPGALEGMAGRMFYHEAFDAL
ncbi:MAG: N-acetyltransferase [Gammaproteobacteria bacterium]|nr:N-acetyltransferase [Gammaproteobacteria bacterium]